MKEYWPAPKTDEQTIRQFEELLDGEEDPAALAKAWTDAGFDDEDTVRWLKARCYDAQAARSLADMGVLPEQAAKRTRDGGGYVDTIGYKVAHGDLTARQGAARCLSSR